jgi:hypothetical protein
MSKICLFYAGISQYGNFERIQLPEADFEVHRMGFRA